jgi:vitamin B12 transporter
MSSRFFAGCALGAACLVTFIARAPEARADAGSTPSPTPSAAPIVATPTASASALPEIGRVSTSDRRVEPIGLSSRPTFVVDRARIDAYGARSVGDALTGIPGVELFQYGASGAQIDYGIRGALSAQTLVLVDGSPVADPTSGTAPLALMSTLGVERIEVVESGTSTLYGTSAAGGVINVLTRVPSAPFAQASYGSFDDRDARVALGNGTFGASFERRVATNAFGYPGFTYGANGCAFFGPPCSFPAGVRDAAYFDQSTVRLGFDRSFGDGLRVRARYDDTGSQGGVPGSLTFLTPTASQGYSSDGGLLEIERASRASTLTLSLSATRGRLAYNDPANGGEDDVYTGRTQLALRDALSFARFDVVGGIDLARESGTFTFPQTAGFGEGASAVPAFGVGASQAQTAAYVQVGAAPFDGARFTAGLRAENDSPHGTVLVPSFGGVLRSGAIRFAGNVGETFRVPTLNDLYYPGFSNPNLVPEKATNADVTVSDQTRAGTLSLGWFGRNGSNFVVYDPVQNIPVNARRAQTAGLTFTAATPPVGGLVASVDATDLYRALDLTTGARLPREPVLQGSVSVSHPFARGAFSYGMRFGVVGSDGDDKANVPPPLTGTYDAYSSLDAFVRYRVGPDAIVSVRGFNLGDDRGVPIFGYPSPGRRFVVEVGTR